MKIARQHGGGGDGRLSRRSMLRWLASFPLLAVAGRAAQAVLANEAVGDDNASADEAAREKRYASLAKQFAEAYNQHDLERALSFFSDAAKVTINGCALEDREAIREFLVQHGATTEAPALAGARMAPEVSYFIGDAYLVEGRIFGRHQAAISGFPATKAFTPIAFAAFYAFDDDGRCTTCDITLNWGAFFGVV